MSTIQEVSAEQLAKLFHHYREALAQDCESRRLGEGVGFWESASPSERKLLVAAARLALLELSTAPASRAAGRKYYATPGEADWGC